jgi:hypothetical protein
MLTVQGIPDEHVTNAEAAALTPVCVLGALVVGAWAGDLAGLPVSPVAAVPLAACVGVPCLVALWRGARPDPGGLVAWGAVTVATLVLLLRWAWPSLLPLGSGPDLVHHLALIRYIETHRSLVHDPAAERLLGEMVSYTPGSHLLAVLGGQALGVGGFRVVHGLVALAVALKAGLVSALTMRAARGGGWTRVATGLTAALFLFLPRDYTLGSFAHDSYIAQVVAETFAVAAWWAIAAWDDGPSRSKGAVLALALAATFLAWPIWVGPLALAFVVVAMLKRELALRDRLVTTLVTLAPLAVVAGVYVIGRLAWAGIVKTSGAVLTPSLRGFGLALILPGVAGLALAGGERRVRATAVVLGALALQAVALFAVAKSYGAHTPYMAYKMFYLAAAPLAVCAALALERIAAILAREARVAPLGNGRVEALAMTLALLVVGGAVVRAQVEAPPPRPAVTLPMAQAAAWLRVRGEVDCVDYLTTDWVSAYWLHVAELGHPRASRRTEDITDRFDRRAVIGRWIDPRGDYALGIAEDFDQLPRDARIGLEVLARFGPAAVVRRRGGRGTIPCPGPAIPPAVGGPR